MCGICGVIQVGGTPRPVLGPGYLEDMTSIISHRGPDDSGYHVADGIAIGARRLSIVDVAGGHQPFANENETVWAAQNGELYNHAQLRDGLQRDGHRFRSRCDTEVLPHLYERDGDSLVDRLRGMFAIVVWDARRRRAVLARDRLGIKPLYYAPVGDLIVFGSELKSVLASGLVELRVDVDAIDAYLTLGYVPGPRSPIEGVFKLMPGERLVVGEGGFRLERFWRYPEPTPGSPRSGMDEYGRELLRLLDESVRLRLMADVPLGAMLSGGLDSSLIVSLMARHSTGSVKTFSIGFREAGEASELADARLVAQQFGTEHHEIELSYSDASVDLADLLWHLDEPVADLSSLGFLALSELAAQHVTVALSGQGADELLGGYLKHRAAALCGGWNRLPAPIHALGRRVAPYANGRFERAARTLTAPDPASRLLAMSSKFDARARAGLARGQLAEARPDPALGAIRAALGSVQGTPLATTLYLDGQLALVDDMLHYFDRASMAHSLEVRVPFLDHHLVEFAATIPDAFKVRRLETKAILKHAARGLIPDRIIDKPKQGFFREGVSAWFRAQTNGAIADYLQQPNASVGSYVDSHALDRMVADHMSSADRGRNGHLLLAVLMLEVWLSTYVTRFNGARDTRQRIPA